MLKKMNTDRPNASAKQIQDFLEDLRCQVVQAKSTEDLVKSLAEKMQDLPLSDQYPGQSHSSNKSADHFDFSQSKILGVSEAQCDQYSAVLGKNMGQILPIEVSTTHSVLLNIMSATGRLVIETEEDAFTSYNRRMNKVLLGTGLPQLGTYDFFEGPSRELGANMEQLMSLSADHAKVVKAARKSLGGVTMVQSRSESDGTNLIKRFIIPFLLCKESQEQVVVCCATDSMADAVAREIDVEMTAQAATHAHVSRQYIVRLYLEAASRSTLAVPDMNASSSSSKDFDIHGIQPFQEVLRNASVIVSTTDSMAPRRILDAIESSTTSLILEGNTSQAEMKYLPMFVARFKRDPKVLVLGDLQAPLPPPWIDPARFVLARQTQLTFMKRMVTVGHPCIALSTAHRSDRVESDDLKASSDASKTAKAESAKTD